VRNVVIAIVLLACASPVAADSIEDETGAAVDPAPEIKKVDDKTGSAKHPTELMRERQALEQAGEGGRSGFWTSRQPAKGGAYRWRLLLIGVGLIGIMGGAIVYFIKRANKSNQAARRDPWADWVAKKKAAEKKPDEATSDKKPAEKKPDEATSDKKPAEKSDDASV
jgi:hypothetical protein